MKILAVSIPGTHTTRWINQLSDANHEIFWFDILNRGYIKELFWVHQFTNWKKRKVPYIKGEDLFSRKIPWVYNKVRSVLELTEERLFENILMDIRPDVVQSFEMQNCCYPIVSTMSKFPQIKWIYNCWGNDIFYFQNFKNHKKKIHKVLSRTDYLFSDCNRDFVLAKQNGFKGNYLGKIPGGGGYDLERLEKFCLPLKERNTIIIKGYEHKFGRAINVLKAISEISSDLKSHEIVVFGAHQSVVNYLTSSNNNLHKINIKVVEKKNLLPHEEILKIMGKSKIYIGNNISDGMPNTLLEAIIMGAFPIQSNPGGATEEIIENGKNGLIINNPNNISEIVSAIRIALNENLLETAFSYNQKLKTSLSSKIIKPKVVKAYSHIEKNL